MNIRYPIVSPAVPMYPPGYYDPDSLEVILVMGAAAIFIISYALIYLYRITR